MNHFHKGSDENKTNNGVAGIFAKVVCVLLALYFIYYQQWIGLIILLPVLLIGSLASRLKSDAIASLIIIFIIFQGLAIWYLSSHDIFHSKSSKPINQINEFAQQYAPIVDNSHREATVLSITSIEPEIKIPAKDIRKTNVFSTTLTTVAMNDASSGLISHVVGKMFHVDFPDLKYRSREEVRAAHPKVFEELPVDGFDPQFKNPCWHADSPSRLACLPYAYILGQPKCGTSDLFERMKNHDKIIMPRRKEVRWFTRGEFTTSAIPHEGGEDRRDVNMEGPRHGEILLGPASSLFSFASSFQDISKALGGSLKDEEVKKQLITIDGGPHTLWWPTQSPDGSFLPGDIPPPQMVRELQPHAKFIVTLSDPVRRMYSDYYFLEDNLKPVRPGAETDKSAEQFHSRSLQQIEEFNFCIEQYSADIRSRETNTAFLKSNEVEERPLWFRAAQMCAHNRHQFGVGGWGRLNIGLYVLYIEKWLEHFPPTQFLVVRLEDYANDPRAYMERVFDFLEVGAPDDWGQVLRDVHYNEHRVSREPILPETEKALNDFYRPYNDLLASLLDNAAFKWDEVLDRHGVKTTLHDLHVKENQLEEIEKSRNPRGRPGEHGILPRGNQHGVERHQHPAPGGGDLDGRQPEDRKAAARRNPGLRGGPRENPEQHEKVLIKLTPRNFTIEDLHYPQGEVQITTFFGKEEKDFSDQRTAASQLCISAYGLDIPAMKFLLYDVGVPSDLMAKENARRNAFHCLALIYTMVDPHPRSQLFAHLKGQESWLTPHLDPPLDVKQASILSRDIMDSLEGQILKVAQWLQRAGVPPAEQDISGHTPLHLAALGGELNLVRLLLKMGVPLDVIDHEGRTALHYAAAYGHAEVAGLLLEFKADRDIQDKFGVSALDILKNPGPVSAEDALRFTGITQRPVKTIGRIIHPERSVNDSRFGWAGGDGGWGPERLAGFEEDMACDCVDQFWADEITGEEIFSKYIARNAPVLIRGLLTEWDATFEYEHDILREDHGHIGVQVSDIPYAEKFGGARHVDMKLSEYIDEVREHRMVGGKHPWYVFKPNPIPGVSEARDSLVRYDLCPTPEILDAAFEKVPPATVGERGPKGRQKFVNAQWALGGEGTGAPIHFHNTAWNALVYGAKKWVIYPPHHMIMSNKQILDFIETDMKTYADRKSPVTALTCVQTAGDVMIIPESWGHGVLNIQESVAVASEAKHSMFRITPQTSLFGRFPAFEK